jgi:hypothetical protein
MSSFGIFINLHVGAKHKTVQCCSENVEVQNIPSCCPRYSINVLRFSWKMPDYLIRFSTKFGDFPQISVKVLKINHEKPFCVNRAGAYE